MIKVLKTYFLLFALTLITFSCRDKVDFEPAGSETGRDVTVSVPLNLPQMEVKSRANLEDYQINSIQSVWIRTYSASGAGKATMDQWLEIAGKALTPHEFEKVTLETKSGPSYIVAVANVENALGVTKDDLTPRALDGLLKNADTWQKFLDIAVAAPSSYYDIDEPQTPLVMAGCFIEDDIDDDKYDDATHPDTDEWQTDNFKSYDIPSADNGVLKLDGAIHLRRIVSQITFNLIPDKDIRITPNSYRVVNVPVYSWLYERDATRQANFGDAAVSAEDAKKYYTTTDIYPGTSFEDGDTDGSYRFSFWQAENKHEGISSGPHECKDYNDRQKKTEAGGMTLFTSLTGDIWSANNMASYVIINCSVDHKGQLHVDEDGKTLDKNNPDGKDVYRSGNASYIIHLGYMNKRATDFNSYRNTKYTYNVRINGVNQIRVEAFKEGDTNGVEGLVTDVLNPTYMLDCHYHAYNISLTDTDLTNFGFITSTYDSGVVHTYQDTDFEKPDGTYRQMTDQEREYVCWVQMRPTTDATTLAEYRPETGENADGATSNLLDAARGLTAKQKSTTGWYTVFINEYTYEGSDGKESGTNWQRYVNQPSRRFYIRVTREISDDSYSLYARSKYAGIQQSIQTYYSNRQLPDGGVLGIEHENEVFGLNVNRTYTYADNAVNGRYNVWLWLNGIKSGDAPENGAAAKKWDDVTRPKEMQHIYAVNKQGITISEHDANVPSLAYGSNDYKAGNIEVPEMLPLPEDKDASGWIEAVNACMNRNRDNNGNGQIDPEELRWYVPARGKYLRMILGHNSLATPLADYSSVSELTASGKGDDVSIKNCTALMLFSSEGNAIICFNGPSTSMWCGTQDSYISSSPWNVRCVRNLGTDLSTIVKTDKTVPAYTHDEATRTVSMTYYDANSYRRVESFSGNGTTDGTMPVHIISQERYNRPFAKFQYSQGTYNLNSEPNSRYDGVLAEGKTYLSAVENEIYKKPCASLGEEWRLPNIFELSIMRNLGVFDNFYTYNSGQVVLEYVISCTKAFFDNNGKGYSIMPSTERNYLGIVYNNTVEVPTELEVLGWDSWYRPIYGDKWQLSSKKAYYRCVRDVR